VASAVLPPRGLPGRLDRFLLRRGVDIIALGGAEQHRYAALGLAAGRIQCLRPAVVPGKVEKAVDLPIPARDVVLLVVGPLTAEKSPHTAVWALDILRKVYPHLHLVVAGSGPDRARAEEFARNIRALAWVHFVGEVPSVWPLLERADIVWAPALAECGRCSVLEAMAAGRPVVASRWPGLAEIVIDEATGFLVPPGDKAALARQTRRLIEDADLRRRLGEAGRRRALEEFTVEAMVRDAAGVYEEAGRA
jgi:glycosyltransferase involved in cell wall biosynthesis